MTPCAIAWATLALVCAAGPATKPATPSPNIWDRPPSVEPQFLLGTEKKLARPIRRIVTVAPSVTEMLFALDVGDLVVGVSRYDDRPESVKSLPKVGGFLDPNVEAVLALEPDLVIGVPNAGNRLSLERIARLGRPVLIVPGNTFSDIFHALERLGDVLGPEVKARSQRMSEEIRSELVRLARMVRDRPAPRVAVVYGWNPLILAGPDSFADTVVGALNGKNIVASGPQYPHYSVEGLLQARPDVIIDSSDGHSARKDAPWAAWTSIPAVRNGRVHSVELGGVLRPGPRIVDGMRLVARLLHPTVVDQ